ncbi:hypothetical protein FNH22_15340 [Fulvivirga sp. M361]|uniref:DUF6588 family protein n=1 Tax=Fulvivirga sp. M361 TaxID=2594266 RepID=UPI00117A883A|nr:DUF6588 family protein [Fulvivirga sp. M361]TRX57780.1 hypothetical protein FNH22_15340 [Fulvivirga sp. M361]
MKTNFYQKSIFILGMITLCYTPFLSAQNDFDVLLKGGIEDANQLIEGYVNPMMTGFGTALSNGWYNTAAPHKPFGMDLTVTANVAFIPDDDLFYNPGELRTITLDAGANSTLPDGQVPTFFGPDIDPQYRENSTGETFQGPPGLDLEDEIGLSAVPLPMAQLGIGIIKNTDIKIRWTPEVDIEDGDGSVKLLGFGVMHDVKQHIPGMKNLPFDLSAFVGYTNFKADVDLSDGNPNEDQTGEFRMRTLTIQGLISKKFSVLTLYGGLGFNRVRSDLAMKGEYTVEIDNTSETFVDPVNLDFKAGGPRATAGFRLKLAILTLHADYTLQEYKTLTVGLGFSFREN